VFRCFVRVAFSFIYKIHIYTYIMLHIYFVFHSFVFYFLIRIVSILLCLEFCLLTVFSKGSVKYLNQSVTVKCVGTSLTTLGGADLTCKGAQLIFLLT
jgi:hypothetical protein